MTLPTTLPQAQRRLLTLIIDTFSRDSGVVGIGASGSCAVNNMDEYSDLDLPIAVAFSLKTTGADTFWSKTN